MSAPVAAARTVDPWHAFVADGYGQLVHAEAGRTQDGPLRGRRLAVKDVFDIAGFHTGAGNPVWRQEAPFACRHALAVERLLAAGARFVGKTVTDELTYSLAGINAHYGTPVNPAAPDRLAGGSSSGSVVAVASGQADIALGTDCGGSVRLPASYCGIWGMRPTHGRISSRGCLVLAHSFDTVGWFARTPDDLEAAFCALACSAPTHAEPLCMALAEPGFLALLDPAIRERFAQWRQTHADVQAVSPALPLSEWFSAFRILQAAEAWMEHGMWVTQHAADLGADIRKRFELAATVNAAQVAQAQQQRTAAIHAMQDLLATPSHVLVFPTVPSPAPLLSADAAQVEDIRIRSQQLLCIAGLAGLPQLSMPWTTVDGAPVGLSIVGARGSDETVLAAARRLVSDLQP